MNLHFNIKYERHCNNVSIIKFTSFLNKFLNLQINLSIRNYFILKLEIKYMHNNKFLK